MNIRFCIVICVVISVASFPGEAREFKNTQGIVIEAELKKVSGEQVTIVRKLDSREFTIPITSLSKPDQDYIAEWLEKNSVKPHSDVKPGAQIAWEFPDLSVDRKGNPAKIGIRIPSSYDPAKPIPLFVWLSGGEGSNSATTSGVVDGNQFITAGFPYPKGANNPGQANMVGDYDTIWEKYHQPMLTELFKRIPNLDRRLCILGGFSNGAHCIAGVLGDASKGGYPEFFNCYILVDGGNGERRLKGGKGNFLFATWGETSPNASRAEDAAKKASGMEVEMFEMKKTGHAFGESGKGEVKKWLEEVVYPATIEK